MLDRPVARCGPQGEAGPLGAVLYYRIYPLGPDGRYLPPIELECDSDEAALAALTAVDPPPPHGCEIWQQKRFLGRFRVGPGGVAVRQP